MFEIILFLSALLNLTLIAMLLTDRPASPLTGIAWHETTRRTVINAQFRRLPECGVGYLIENERN